MCFNKPVNSENKTKLLFFKGRTMWKGSKAVFEVAKNLIGHDKNINFPICDSDVILADRFVSFFSEKVANIYDSLKDNLHSFDRISRDNIAGSDKTFGAFQPISIFDIETIILRMPSKSCSLDPLPTKLVKMCIKDLTPVTYEILC